MVTQEQVKEKLESVLVPSVMRSLVKMNLVREINIEDGKVDITLGSATMTPDVQEWLKKKIEEDTKLDDVDTVNVSFTDGLPKDFNEIGNVIAVMSGKGGVGKSLVASLAAVSLQRQGYEVGILDADITGPSIPRMFGINTRPVGSESGILPVSSRSGVEVMSMNLLLGAESDAVIWRGPLIGKAITQFWEEVLWGKLDYLVVDLPPGTADAPLTVLQTLPVSGIIIVSTPQDLTSMVVKKAVNMARQMSKPIIGVVENMSYLYVSEIDKKLEIFGKSRGQEMAADAGVPLLANLPVDPELAKLCDEGKVELYNTDVLAGFEDSLSQAVKVLP
ncbi:MAG: Mrp/NBP35 family ATP-binding protein [Dehalococcoidales bacterium]|nr:Mrp/NBP35 family ATP-binding protein [Dehalococcoidales bacterium]